MLYCTFSKHPISGVSVRLTLQHVHRKCRHGYILNHYCPLPEVRWSHILCELAAMFESASYIAVWIVYPCTQCMCATGCVDLCISISLWVWLKHTGIPSCVFARCSLVNCLPLPSSPTGASDLFSRVWRREKLGNCHLRAERSVRHCMHPPTPPMSKSVFYNYSL